MDPELRRAWTEIVTAADYDQHMTAIGQAQAAAELTRYLIEASDLQRGSRVVIVGAGTGQMFDLLDPDLFRPYRLIVADLNPLFLTQLRERLTRQRLDAEIVVDESNAPVSRPGAIS